LAKRATAEKRDVLKKIRENFEHWKSTNKKRKTRQAMLKGEIDPKEIEFEKEDKIINGQIDLCIFKENTIKVDKELTEQILSQLKRDANKEAESLRFCKRLLTRYSVEDKLISGEIINQFLPREFFDKPNVSEDANVPPKLERLSAND
jgi:hypothetical protein